MTEKLKKNLKFIIPAFIILALLGLYLFLSSHNVQVLNPKGVVAAKQRRLIIESTLLMLIVVVPVYILTFLIAWNYRSSNKKSKYQPDFDRHKKLEAAWWVIPGLIILILSVITWRSSYALDPFKPLPSSKPPLTIQVVALQWRWLFIYPEQDIATVNYVQFPNNTPINFEITSDAPMNSFWIPQLAGQIYAMPGMSTQLHLMASNDGTYRGSSANISGEGFASMHFTARSSSNTQFDKWLTSTRQVSSVLDISEYNKLARPNDDVKTIYYSQVDSDLYDQVVMKYMSPSHGLSNSQYLPHESHHE